MKFLRFLPLLLWAVTCYGQGYKPELNRVLPPSPTAAGLGKFGEFGTPGLYTGSVDISVPIYTVNYRDANVPIALSYNSGGIRPSDIAGWVGLGWSLMAGGVITRVVQDQPDDFSGNGALGFYHGRSVLDTMGSDPGIVNVQENTDRFRDFKPDKFMFNFNGISGKFSFDTDGNPVLLSQKKYKIEFTTASVENSASDYFNTFTITTDDGAEYVFAAREWSKSQIGHYGDWMFYVSSWYLTQINSPNGSVITFSYTSNTTKFRYKESSFQKIVTGSVAGDPASQGDLTSGEFGTNVSMDQVIYLDEINFGSNKVKFKTSVRNDLYYKPSHITDVEEERKLDSIIVSYDGTVLKKWAFGYVESSLTRMQLTSLTEMSASNQSLPPYEFDYITQYLPSVYNSNDTDHWGFYNSANNTSGRIPITYVPLYNNFFGSAIRDVNKSLLTTASLERITYPTGGYTQFTFEPHDFSFEGANAIENVEYVWTNPIELKWEDAVFSQDPSTLTFTLSQTTQVQLYKACQEINGPYSNWCNGSGYQVITLNSGTYNFRDLFDTDLLSGPQNTDVDNVDMRVMFRDTIVTTKLTGGGIRIAKIQNYDSTGKLSERRFEYKLPADTSRSSGVLSKMPVYLVSLNDIWSNASGAWLQSESIESMPDGPSVAYSNVREILADDSYIDYEYSTYKDYYDSPALNIFPISHNLNTMISNDYLRGKELSRKVYTAGNTLLRATANEYEDVSALSHNIKAWDNKLTLMVNGYYLSLVGRYAVPSRFYVLKKTTGTSYDGATPVTTETTYGYGTNHLQQNMIKTSRSGGESTVTHIRYPHDYTGIVTVNSATQGLKELQDNNEASTVVEQYTTILNPNASVKGYAQGMYTSFNTDAQPQYMYSLSNEALLGSFTPSAISGGNSVAIDGSYDQRIHISGYGLYGVTTEQKQAGGAPVTYIWSYDYQFPVAEIKNASYSAVETALGGSSALNAFSADMPTPSEVNTFFSGLRAALPNAQVTTMIHIPGVGIKSTTDSKGMTTSYEYDEFNRLKQVRDQNGNVVKTFQYNYKQ